jgi:LysR family transcriptional regulator, glycine cleavage system transcriptional activator
MKRLPPLSALEAFVVVARHESLTVASHQLNLTVSAISRRIQTLEQDLGTKLFERQKRKFALLPTGQRLLDDVAPTLEILAHTADHYRQSGKQTSLRIGVMQAFATTFLLPRLKNFNMAQPNISLEFDTQPQPLSRLGTELDAAIVLLADPLEHHFCEKLAQNYIVPVCAPALLQNETAAQIADPRWLTGKTALLHREVTSILPIWQKNVGFPELKPKRIDIFDSGALLLEAAASGLGVAFMLDITVAAALADGRLIEPFKTRIKSPLSFCFVAKETATRDRSLSRFYAWLSLESAGAIVK